MEDRKRERENEKKREREKEERKMKKDQVRVKSPFVCNYLHDDFNLVSSKEEVRGKFRERERERN